MQEVLPGEASEPARGQEAHALPGLRLRARPPLVQALPLAILSGLVLSLAFPPAGWWPLAFVAPIPLLWLLRDASAGRGALLGFVFGLAFYGATLYWILRFGELAWAALVLLAAASTAIFGLLVPAVRRAGHPLRSAFGVAALWTLIDWIRAAWPLGGFSWGALGVSQVDNRVTLRVASIAGVWGVTFLVIAAAALFAEALAGHGGAGRRGSRALLALALIVAPALVAFPTVEGPSVDVASLQVDVREARGSSAGEDIGVAALHASLHRSLASDPPDLAIWGEGALDPGATRDPATMAAVSEVVAGVGAPTLIGAVVDDLDGEQRTTALLLDGSGALVDRYDKVHLVPFGEYVPWRSHLSFIDAIDQIPVDRAPGERVHALEVADVPRFGAPICFENSFPEIPRAMVNDGATFLIVLVNNASYGTTAASDQHLQMSRIRAVENGRWVVNAAVSGISAFIDPSGRIIASAGLFEPTVLRATIRASDARTPYVRWGDWAVVLSAGFVLVLFALPRGRTTGPAPAPLPAGLRRALVILPTYEERDTIEVVIGRLLELPDAVDVLVVDDASPDGTGGLVAAIAEREPRVGLLTRPARSGLASAYGDGFAQALAGPHDLVVEMDADLSHDPDDLPRLLAAASERVDLAIGSRYVPGGSVTDWSRWRVWLSRAGNRYARFMLGIPVHDATSGFRVYRRELLADLVSTPVRADGYGFQIELVRRACAAGAAVEEVPITFREREHGESKLSRRIVAEALWLVTVWGLRDRFSGRGRTRPPQSR
jgi:apolipoprotein N-acyltransferase